MVGSPGVNGWLAFINYDPTVLTYETGGDPMTECATHYSDAFGTPIIEPVDAELGPDTLVFSAGEFVGVVAGDELLLTIVFTLKNPVAFCTTSLAFDPDFVPPGPASELSLNGVGVATALVGTGAVMIDIVPPTIECPPDIEVESCGPAVVLYPPPIVADNCGIASVVCVPPPGPFPPGPTLVTCTVTDTCGNTDQCTFTVTVTQNNLIDVEVILTGVDPFAPDPSFTQCIHFQTNECGVADQVLTFLHTTGDTFAIAVATIEVPCGESDLESLCAKDAQHSLWDSAALIPCAGQLCTATPLVLAAGDDDNDGDVDINDVTFLIFKFGLPAVVGGCPSIVPGPDRDADVGHNGAVGTQDYSVMTGNYLETSSCTCMAPALGDPLPNLDRRTRLELHELDPTVRDHVDLNGDGAFDIDDVRIFEMLNGLPTALSSKMRAAELGQTK